MTVRRIVRAAGTAAVGVGLVALVYAGLVLARTTAPALAPMAMAPTTAGPEVSGPRRPLVAGESLGQIQIERIGLRVEIREGEDAAVLRGGAGHLPDTAWIGDGGNVALAGHRDTVFRSLRKIQPGDVIEIVTADRLVRYSVDETTVVPPNDLTVLEPSGSSTLTLITCHPFTFIGSAPNRFVVRAREIDPAR